MGELPSELSTGAVPTGMGAVPTGTLTGTEGAVPIGTTGADGDTVTVE